MLANDLFHNSRRLNPCPSFELDAPFAPTGDQPTAIEGLLAGLQPVPSSIRPCLGATGTGKTFTIANIVQATQRPDPGDGAQ